MNIMRWIIIFASLLGVTSIILGAVGDHLLEGTLTQGASERLDVALRYHQLYAVVLFVMGLYGVQTNPIKTYKASCLLFFLGITIFSGSLYASLWIDLGPLSLGTPVGGMMLMSGWILAGFSFLKNPIKK